MNAKEIKKTLRSLKENEATTINGYIVKKGCKYYAVRTGDYMESPYTIYYTLTELVEDIA